MCKSEEIRTHKPNLIFFVILFQFLFISFYLSRNIFTYWVKVKALHTFLHISFADWTLLWTTFRYWNFLLFPQIDSQFEKWSACCIVFTTKTFHIVTQRPSFKKMKPFFLKFLNEWFFKSITSKKCNEIVIFSARYSGMKGTSV